MSNQFQSSKSEVVLPIFFFDFRKNGALAQDETGLEYASAEDAYMDSFHCALDMWSDLLKQRINPLECAFEIRDLNHELLFEVRFSEAIEVCQTHRPAPPKRNNELFLGVVESAARANRLLGDFHEGLAVARGSLDEARLLMGKL